MMELEQQRRGEEVTVAQLREKIEFLNGTLEQTKVRRGPTPPLALLACRASFPGATVRVACIISPLVLFSLAFYRL